MGRTSGVFFFCDCFKKQFLIFYISQFFSVVFFSNIYRIIFLFTFFFRDFLSISLSFS